MDATGQGYPGDARERLVLHACCGPCLLEPHDDLAAANDILVVYANPNIHPEEEYLLRRDTLIAYARTRGIAVEELAYDPEAWDEAVAGVEDDPAARCRACYRLRISLAARHAASLGVGRVATTLTVSPYQDHESLVEEGRAACAEAGVEFVETDYRERYREAVRRSTELGMYRQNFCGCRYSRDEAEAARARRREEKARARAERQRAAETL